MRLAKVRIEEAIGGILVHNVADAQGHKALAKGHALQSADAGKLRALGQSEVYVALLEPGDVRENAAVGRLARAAAGPNLELSQPSGGRINLSANSRGVLDFNLTSLARLNALEGATVATLPNHRLVQPKQMVATVKTIGLALPERVLAEAEAIRAECGPAIRLLALRATRAALVLTGSPEARERVEQSFTEPIRARVQELGGELSRIEYVPEDASAIAGALARALESGVDCVLIAGETSIMDAADITPQGIRQAGGSIELYGAPVEPGNLLLLAYCGDVPVIGAPGCVKSRETNVVDLILPRFFAGERLSRADVVELANGGLLL